MDSESHTVFQELSSSFRTIGTYECGVIPIGYEIDGSFVMKTTDTDQPKLEKCPLALSTVEESENCNFVLLPFNFAVISLSLICTITSLFSGSLPPKKRKLATKGVSSSSVVYACK